MKTNATIETVVENGLCLSCGTCVAVCPVGAISMKEIPGGLVEAQIDEDVCTGCGVCARVCPGGHLEAGILPDKVDPVRGQVLAAFAAKATNRDVLRKGQSGGLVTALLLHLIQNGRIDGAFVSEMPGDGSLRPQVRLTNNPEEIMRTQGSKYCPIPVNEHLADWRHEQPPRRVAFVGIPCHVHGLRNLQTVMPKWKVEPYVTLGLFCDSMLSLTAMDYLIEKAGVSRERVATFRYKSKELGGWPGDIRIESRDGRVQPLSGDCRMECKNYFTPLRCRLCFDKLNFLADISLGDAWGVQEDAEGTSVVIARTQRGMDVVTSARDAGEIDLTEISIDQILQGQGVESRRRDWSAYMTAWARMGRAIPQFDCWERLHSDVERVDLRPYKRNLAYSWRLKTARSSREVVRKAKWSMLPRRLWAKWRPKRVARAVRNRLSRLGIK